MRRSNLGECTAKPFMGGWYLYAGTFQLGWTDNEKTKDEWIARNKRK